jgi:D-glycero-D-manno-heptose 1,7-bisphosphate phosphatase
MLDIFDKDGTLVETKSGEPFPKLGDQRLISGVKERIADSAAAGNIIVVASNQGGIEKGYKRLEDAIAEFQEVMELLPEISACYFCPNFDGTQCVYVSKEGRVVAVHDHWKKYDYLIGSYRKPKPGMLLLAIARELWVPVPGDKKPNKEVAHYTGDRPEDEGAAMNAGVSFRHVNDWLATD